MLQSKRRQLLEILLSILLNFFIGSGLVEPAPLGPCIQLVAASMKERKERAEEEERLRLLAEQTARRQDAMSINSDNKSTDFKRTDNKPGGGSLASAASKGDKQEGSSSNDTALPIPKIFSNEPLYSPKK